jgi:subtilase family serine protease
VPFRSVLGGESEKLPAPPDGGSNSSPGEEASLDPQWASAAAPGAHIVVATCADNGTTPGYLIALQNYVDLDTPRIISMSFGFCEASLGAGGNGVLNTTYQQAATEGFSVFVAAGDAGAALCDWDSGYPYAQYGIAVSGYASNPNVVAVGGTTFADWALGHPIPSPYWSSQNGTYYGSALSYIPEIVWNSSCGNVLLSLFYTNNQQTYGSAGFCNNSQYLNPPYSFLIVQGGSGGPSACAVYPQGLPCVGYPKPNWQSGILGNPADGVRDLPDVSIIAGGPEWGHYLAYCDSSSVDFAECTNGPTTWSRSGGTSFSAPIFAGIQALIDQRVGEYGGNPAVGDPNPTYYALAKTEYGQSGNSNCLSINVTAGNNCIFYDVSYLNSPLDSTIAVPCKGTIDCFLDMAKYGVLSTRNSKYVPAYLSQPGWDFTTGIGSPNVSNLVNVWPIP